MENPGTFKHQSWLAIMVVVFAVVSAVYIALKSNYIITTKWLPDTDLKSFEEKYYFGD